MAWVERIRRGRYRVRHRVEGRIVTDSSHERESTAQLRARDLDSEDRLATLLTQRGVPSLSQWTHSWLFSYLASETALSWNPDYLRLVILPRLQHLPLDNTTRQHIHDLIWELITTWEAPGPADDPVPQAGSPTPAARNRRLPWYTRLQSR